MNILEKRVLDSRQREFEVGQETQIERQARVLEMMQKLDVMGNIIIGPWLQKED